MRTIDSGKFARKRQEILEAAGRCFARDGFRGTAISSICAEAKVSPGHLYHYFASKEAIVEAIIEQGLDDATARFDRLVGNTDAIGALVAEIETVMLRPKSPGARELLLEMMAEARRNPAIGAMLAKQSRKRQTLLAELLLGAQAQGQVDPDLDVESAAAMLLSVIDGAETLTIRDPLLDLAKTITLLKLMIARFLVRSAPPAPQEAPVAGAA